MPRHAEDFRVFKIANSPYYFFTLKGWPRGTRRSTYSKSLSRAHQVAKDASERESRAMGDVTLRGVAEPYYVWDRCPHVRRLLDEGKQISRRYVADCRRRLEAYVFTDPLVDLQFFDILPGDRSRSCASDDIMLSIASVNKRCVYR